MAEAAAEVRRLLEASIRRRLISDVPLGAFLSGGIDSSAIVALMAGVNRSSRSKTFTIGFDDRDGFDERPFARLVAERHGTDHHEFVVQSSAIDLVERLLWHHDQPFGDSSAIPTFMLNELTRGHVTVALSGDGGDELFAGYERFAAGVALAIGRYQSDECARATCARSGGRAVAGLRAAGRALHGRMRAASSRFAGGRRARACRTPTSELDQLRPRALAPRGLLTIAGPAGAATTTPLVSWQRHRWGARSAGSAAGIEPARPTCSMTCWSRWTALSMAHSLEVRSPFLEPPTWRPSPQLRLPPGLRRKGPVAEAGAQVHRAAQDCCPRRSSIAPSGGSGCRWTGGFARTRKAMPPQCWAKGPGYGATCGRER